MASMNTNTEPLLAAPGAGLPKFELLIARVLFGLRCWMSNRDAVNARFARERAALRVLIERCDAETGARRVLIQRPPGLEDSSRNWSVWMTLDHLRIVHGELTRIIGTLARGASPAGEASTAAVKPSPHASAAVVAEYEDSCDALLAGVAEVPEMKKAARFAHPWFGPLDAFGWHALASGHMGIHRVQIERILAGMERAS